MSPARAVPDADTRRPVRLLTAIVLSTVLCAFAAVALLVSSSNASTVQGTELDLAGRQRRLAERIAYDVARMESGRVDDGLRGELALTADRLRSIRLGLLEGDPQLGLDGDVPSSYRRRYAPDGLDLDRRSAAYERAARQIAAGPDTVDPAALAVIDAEADRQRFVLDLNLAVEDLATAAADQDASHAHRALLGLVASGLLGLVSLLALGSVRRRLRLDLAARAELATEIARSEDLYRTTVDALHDAVVVQDDRGHLLQMNEAARRVLLPHAPGGRFDVGDHVTTRFPELLRPDGSVMRPDERPTHRALHDGAPAVGMVAGLRGDDGTRWFRCNAATVDDGDGGSRRVVITFTDITDERERTAATERAHRAALEHEQEVVAKLVELDEARNTFVSTVSHELRTPLTSLVGYLEMLEDGSAGELTDRQRSMVSAGVRNGQRLRKLIDDLLSLSAAGRTESVDRRAVLRLAPLVTDVVEAMSPLGRQAGVELDVGRLDDVHVAGDHGELERILINVVGNAIKFTPSGGSVTIRAAAVDGGRRARLEVADTGVGIPADEQDRLFTRFFRTERATREQVQGTGLGLAICAELVEAHGGSISLTSTEGVGTTVTVELPAADVAPGDQDLPAPAPAADLVGT